MMNVHIIASPQLMASNVSQNMPVLYLQHGEYEKAAGFTISFNLPSLSYIIGFVPCCTPHIFSRIVVLPALALPIMRIWKWGHSYCSLSITICFGSVSIMNESDLSQILNCDLLCVFASAISAIVCAIFINIIGPPASTEPRNGTYR
jgi:hypothetical protein